MNRSRGLTACPRPFAPGFVARLNIFSMRSVMMKPPTTLMVAAGHGDEAEHRGERRRGRAPASTSEPTSEMPLMALVADMSGVWSSGGTRVMMKNRRSRPARRRTARESQVPGAQVGAPLDGAGGAAL